MNDDLQEVPLQDLYELYAAAEKIKSRVMRERRQAAIVEEITRRKAEVDGQH